MPEQVAQHGIQLAHRRHGVVAVAGAQQGIVDQFGVVDFGIGQGMLRKKVAGDRKAPIMSESCRNE